MADLISNVKAYPNGKPLLTYLRKLTGLPIARGQKEISWDELVFKGVLLDGTRIKIYFNIKQIEKIIYLGNEWRCETNENISQR